MTPEKKYKNLLDSLKKMKRVVIAFSGGVDSTFLLKAATLSGLGEILAVTGQSESLPEQELSFTKEIASSFNVKHKIIVTEELKDNNYAENPPDRCYYCKKELFTRLSDIASRENYLYVLDGTNADDIHDRRPGRQASVENNVKSPLLDAGLNKKEIRKISRDLGLPTWDKPATPCLSSRFPYGHKITAEGLLRVDRAEAFIREFGIKELRVRSHSNAARIEVHPEDFAKLTEDTAREKIVNFLRSLGYENITLDLRGFRSGSSNEFIEKNKE
ncbi:MAG TPA: ATP-dependent sacrificial sulfur transferase LarE [Nitrospirae bacterium]|nr:tRNA(Ile)-lysidine synthase [bacterium BMS3Abin09]HDZ84204.1 ATP-dependent sacrificial sulfur transferase LarE [Nitrospirota bacterium]